MTQVLEPVQPAAEDPNIGLTEERVREFIGYLLNEENSLWVQGDRIHEWGLSDEQLQELATRCRRELITLRRRLRVARAFQADEGLRDPNIPWTVYFKLATQIPDPAQRREILSMHPAGVWTVPLVQKEINKVKGTGEKKKQKVNLGDDLCFTVERVGERTVKINGQWRYRDLAGLAGEEGSTIQFIIE